MMWWQVPGPEAAVERVAESIRESRCVLVDCAANNPEGFRAAVRRRSGEDQIWDRLFDDDFDDAPPLDVLKNRLVVNGRDNVRSLSDLAGHDELASRVVWLELRTSAAAEKVMPAFAEFAHAAGGREVFERPSLVVERRCDGGSSSKEMRIANVAAVELFGYSDWIDIRLYAARALRRRYSGVVLEIMSGVLASLAIWDPGLIDFAAEATAAEILSPSDMLIQYGETVNIQADWRTGGKGRIGSTPFEHSSIVAKVRDVRELKRRVWRGQIAPVFTFLEERRLELLERYRPLLSVPTKSGSYDPDTVEDLEISHIKAQVDASAAATVEETHLLGDLKRLRHRLAHLEAASFGDLSRPSLRPWLGELLVARQMEEVRDPQAVT